VTTALVLLTIAAAMLWGGARWRRGLEAVLVLLVLEGAIRKWLVPSAASYVYFAKDALLIGVYVGFLRDPARRALPVRVPPPLAAALAVLTALAAIGVFNPNLPSPLVGLLGFKAYLHYVPLIWVVAAAYRTEREVGQFVRRYLTLALPVALLALAQFFSPADSALNTYARSNMSAGSIVTFGAVERVRVTGTFSFITGYSAYLQVVALLSLTVLAVRQWRLRGSLLYYTALASALLGMLMTGSRGPVFLFVLLMPLYWLFGVARAGLPAFGRFLLGIGLVLSVVNFVGSDAVEAFRARAAGSSDVASRVLQPFVTPFRIAPDIGLLGYGTGATHQMAEAVSPSIVPYSWLGPHHYEDEPSRVMVELGLVGFAAFFAVRIGLVALALGAVFRLARPLPRALALSCLLLFLGQLVGGVVFNVTGGVYYWWFAGLLFAAERLETEARRSAAAARAAAPADPIDPADPVVPAPRAVSRGGRPPAGGQRPVAAG
jgi:hypothetical protein